MPLLVVCPACDLVHSGAPGPARTRTRCSRCRAILQRPQQGRLDSAIALAVSALLLFFLSNAYPLVVMHMNGVTREATLIDAALGLSAQGYAALAVVVLLTTVAAPLAQIGGLLYVLLPLRRGRHARLQGLAFRAVMQLRHWTFIEVFMLGALVALMRLSAFAKVIPGIALLCCGLLMLNLAALTNLTTPEQFWLWASRRRT